MLFRSTGLGKTELKGKVAGMKREGDYLVLHVDVVEPVKWRIRAAMSFRDLAAVMAACMSASIVTFIMSPGQWFNKQPKPPEQF